MLSFENCIRDLQSALQINESDAQVLYKQGLAYFAHKKYKKCIQAMKFALRN